MFSFFALTNLFMITFPEFVAGMFTDDTALIKTVGRMIDVYKRQLGNCRLSAKQVMLAAEKISTDIENGAFDDMLSALDVENVSYYKQLILCLLYTSRCV